MWNRQLLKQIAEYNIRTPFYCFNPAIFIENIGKIKESLDGFAALCFSVKANPWLAEIAAHYTDRIEVCSLGELLLCRDLGIPMSALCAGGVAKPPEDCRRIAALAPARVSAESPRQLQLMNEAAAEAGKKLSVLLRLTSGNQFGMPLEVILRVIRELEQYPWLSVIGLHYYAGTQRKSLKDAERVLSDLTDAAAVLPPEWELEFGPGIGAPLFYGQKEREFAPYAERILQGVSALSENRRIILECGRCLAYNVGIYVTSVIDIKEQCGRRFIITDGGIHHLSYYGQIGGKPVPELLSYPFRAGKCAPCVICGALCTAGDILANDVLLPELCIDDKLIFANVGAYAVTEGRSLFLSRDLPAVFLLDGTTIVPVRDQCPVYGFNKPNGQKGLNYG